MTDEQHYACVRCGRTYDDATAAEVATWQAQGYCCQWCLEDNPDDEVLDDAE